MTPVGIPGRLANTDGAGRPSHKVIISAGASMKYSFVVPIYNDGALAHDFCIEMRRTFRAYLETEDLRGIVELLFVDDGSMNDSPAVLKALCDEFDFVRMAAFSRNFGQHIAIAAGYRLAKGEFVGMLNVDQEDPPSQIPLLLDALAANEDCDIAGGLHDQRHVPWFTGLTSRLFHKTMNRLTGYDVPINSATLRVLRRRAVDRYNALTERNRYFPGLEMWLGFKYCRVKLVHQPRRIGSSSYNFRRRLRMAIAAVISFSDFPLRLAVKFGLLTALAGAMLSAALIAEKLFSRELLPGYTSTIAVIVFLGGVQIVVTGIASLYIGRILAEVQGRPEYVVRETYEGRTASCDG